MKELFLNVCLCNHFISGDQHDEGLRISSVERDAVPFVSIETVPKIVSMYSHIKISYSTYPGFFSYRHPSTGTYFIISMLSLACRNLIKNDNKRLKRNGRAVNIKYAPQILEDLKKKYFSILSYIWMNMKTTEMIPLTMELSSIAC